MTEFNPAHFTPETIAIRKALFDSGDRHLVPLHKALTDEQIRILRVAFKADRDDA